MNRDFCNAHWQLTSPVKLYFLEKVIATFLCHSIKVHKILVYDNI